MYFFKKIYTNKSALFSALNRDLTLATTAFATAAFAAFAFTTFVGDNR